MTKTVDEYKQELERIDSERENLSKQKHQWEDWRKEWHYYQQQEGQILEEIAYFSEGTVSQNQAHGQLSHFDFEVRQYAQAFSAIDDELIETDKKLRKLEDELIEKKYLAEQEELQKDAEN